MHCPQTAARRPLAFRGGERSLNHSPESEYSMLTGDVLCYGVMLGEGDNLAQVLHVRPTKQTEAAEMRHVQVSHTWNRPVA